MSVEIPKVAIAFGAIGIPQGDVIELRVHLGCTKEVGSFDCLLQNWDKKYSPSGSYPINVGMDGHIDIGRGTNVPQIITLRVESVKCESTPTENYIRVSGRCWGEKLFRRVVTKTYENQKGEAIVKDLMDSYALLSHTRTANLTQDAPQGQPYVYIASTDVGKFFVGQKVVISDSQNSENNEIQAKGSNWLRMKNALSHTYTVANGAKVDGETVEATDTIYSKLEYENTPVFDILKYVAESSDKAGVIGYDFRVGPDGKFEFFAKNSKTSPVSLGEKIEVSEYRKDIHRVRNKIMIYGLADKSVPADKDAWTESLNPADGSWSAGAGEVYLDTNFKAKGSASIKVYAINLYWAGGIFTLNAGKEVNANLYPILSFYAYLEKTYDGNVTVLLYDVANKEASKHINIAPGEWRKIDVRVGLANEMDWTWVQPGFDWSQIKKIRIDGWLAGVGTGSFWIDALYFGGRRYAAVREDSASQTAYGLRELAETDEELVSDNECDLRAKALLDYFKGPAEYLTIRSTVIDYGNSPLLPGDKTHITLPNENVDADFRIESVEYYVDAKTQTLQVTLELGKVPPLLADYLYGMRATTVTVEKLARTKLGKKGIPTVAYGGGIGAHHVGHEAGDQAGNKWPSEDYGGWDKLTGWICPKYIGPFDDEPAIMKFRTRNKAGTSVLNHQFQPSDIEAGVLGCETAYWKEIHSKFLVLYRGLGSPYGDLRIKVQGESNPRARLTEELLEFGPGGAAADVYLKRIAENTLELKTWYLKPQGDDVVELGEPAKKIKKVYATSFLLPSDGFLHIGVYGEDNPRARLVQDSIAFGSGGASAPDTWLKRIAANQFESSGDVIPDSDDARTLGLGGATPKRWKNIYAVNITISNMLFNFHVIPDADNTYDIGEGTTPKRWRDLYLAGAIKALAGGVAVNLLPDADGSRDLGSSGKKWSNLYVAGLGRLGWLNIGDVTVITSDRTLQNVIADAAIIASGQFPLARLPRGSAGYVLEAQGAGFDPMYVNPNYRYEPKSHPHSQHTGIGPDDHHARDHDHVGENLSPNQVNCNNMSIAVSCNRQYTHPSTQQCVYASSVAWENCPRFYCVNYNPGDIVFVNKFRITESEKLGFNKGLAFLNPKGKVLLVLDGKGNLHVAGKVKEGLPRKAKAGVAA